MSILLNTEVCPQGPLTGPIIKPMAWRVLNDHRRFVADWDEFVRRARLWQRAHPVRLLEEWLIQRDRERIRRLWYALTPAERQRLKDIRAETGVRIVAMRPFNGIKYQRGMLCGLSVKRAAAPGAATLSLSSSNNDASNVEVSPANNLYASFQVERDGDLRRDQTGDDGVIGRVLAIINGVTDWIKPATASIGDSYEVKWNHLGGTVGNVNDENYTEDVWATISTDRRVSKLESGTSTINTFELDIGDVGTSISDINQNYSIEAGDLL